MPPLPTVRLCVPLDWISASAAEPAPPVSETDPAAMVCPPRLLITVSATLDVPELSAIALVAVIFCPLPTTDAADMVPALAPDDMPFRVNEFAWIVCAP